MTYYPVQSPYPIFNDEDGTPLEDGYIYIGEAYQNPITNPITASWDTSGLYPAAQPIRTIGGYPDRNGSPGIIYVNAGAFEDYSILVNDKNGNQVYFEQSARSAMGGYGGNSLDIISDLRAISGYDQPIYVRSHTNIGDEGGGTFEWIDGAAPGTYTDDNGKIIVPTGGDGSGAWLRQYTGYIYPQWYGVVADGSTNTTTTFQACIDANTNENIYLKKGEYYFTSGIALTTVAGMKIIGCDGAEMIFEDGAYSAITITDVDGLILEKLKIRGTDNTTPTITLLEIDTATDDVGGVQINNCIMNRALTCIYGAKAAGNEPYSIRIVDSTFSTSDKYIDMFDGLEVDVHGCTFGAALALTVDPVVYVHGRGCKVHHNQFETDVTKPSIKIGYKTSASYNYITYTSGRIVVEGYSNIDLCDVSHNQFRNMAYGVIAGHSPYAIETEYLAAGGVVNIIGNMIGCDNSNAVTCIYHETGMGGTVANNHIYRAGGGVGIYCKRGVVTGNSFIDVLTPVYTDAGSNQVKVLTNFVRGSGGVYSLTDDTYSDLDGTFTPVVAGTTLAGVGTYTDQQGTYQRFGRWVMFRLYVSWTAHTGTGTIYISGLPFTSNATRNCPVSITPSNLTFSNQVAAYVASSTDRVYVVEVATGAGITGVNMDTSANLTIAGLYEVDY